MRWTVCCALLIACACGGAGDDAPGSAAGTAGEEPPPVIAPDVAARLAQYAPTELSADLAALSAEDRAVLAKLVAAARYMDEIFLRQVWRGNPELRQRLAGLAGERAAAARDYFDLNFGPWDRLAASQPFIGDAPHPPGAGFYPEDLTKDELAVWIAAHPADQAALESLTTLVERQGGALVAVPYSQAFKEFLDPAAALLRAAAAATSNASLRKFLELRADAFASDDYYESDMAWMDLDAPVEVTIGPYETYEDGLFGYKASFEAFVTVALPAESAKLDRYKAELPWLERNLPIPDEDKNLSRGSESPIRVVDEVFTAGDTKAGVQTTAFNLPNDERVREAKGSKKVLLRNVMRAKYDQILTPIAARVLTPEQQARVSFDAFFEETLHHELSHGLGPGKITVDGRATEVRLELKELYSTIEEAKADVCGVYDILALIDRGVIPADLRETLEPTYVAGLFRSARFGVHEAHGQGVVAQFNYLEEKGALEVDEQGRFETRSEAFPGAIRDLLHDLLMLEAKGDYAGTVAFLDRYGKQPGPALLAALDRLKDLPVDVRPLYTGAPE
jgi:Peptidase family M49